MHTQVSAHTYMLLQGDARATQQHRASAREDGGRVLQHGRGGVRERPGAFSVKQSVHTGVFGGWLADGCALPHS